MVVVLVIAVVVVVAVAVMVVSIKPTLTNILQTDANNLN